MIRSYKYTNWRFFIITLLISGLFILGAIFLMSHLFMALGAARERAEKECVSASAIRNWENTLNIAQAICVDSQASYVDNIKSIYELQIKKLEEEATDWEAAYYWLKYQPKEDDDI